MRNMLILAGVMVFVLGVVLALVLVPQEPLRVLPDGGMPQAWAEREVPPPGDEDARAPALYRVNCLGCHGEDASDLDRARQQRQGPEAPTLSSLGPQWLYWRISVGVDTAMPAFEDRLTEEERWALVRWLRDRWGE